MMKRLIYACCWLAAMMASGVQASWQIVTHADSALQSLKVEEARFLFTEGQIQGQVPELIDLKEEPLRAQFYEEVLSMTLNRWRAIWAKRVFTGSRRLPKQLALDYVVQYLETNPSSVAYLPDHLPLPPTLKVIYCSPKLTSNMAELPCTTANDSSRRLR